MADYEKRLDGWKISQRSSADQRPCVTLEAMSATDG